MHTYMIIINLPVQIIKVQTSTVTRNEATHLNCNPQLQLTLICSVCCCMLDTYCNGKGISFWYPHTCKQENQDHQNCIECSGPYGLDCRKYPNAEYFLPPANQLN